MTEVTEREMGLAQNHDGEEVMMKEYTIKSESMTAKILNYGGILNVLEVKDKNNGRFILNCLKNRLFLPKMTQNVGDNFLLVTIFVAC